MKEILRFGPCGLLICLLLTPFSIRAGENAPVITPENAKKYVDQEVVLEMTVLFGKELPASGCCFLDSEKDLSDPRQVTIFISAKGMQDLKASRGIEHPHRYFFLHKISVAGTVTLYKQKPEIKVESADQIKDLEGPKPIAATEAKDNVGKNVIVEFAVEASKELTNSDCCFLNSEEDLENSNNLTIFISSTGLNKFRANPQTAKPAEYFLHKKIRVTGTITQYKQKPDIRVFSPEQIEVIEDDKT